MRFFSHFGYLTNTIQYNASLAECFLFFIWETQHPKYGQENCERQTHNNRILCIIYYVDVLYDL